MAALSDWVGNNMHAGPLRGLLMSGVIAGAGSVLVFLPQILILFLFILALEDSGYLPRAAYMLDRLMGKVGLSGRAFIPLLSSFACAIPGIMAARTIPIQPRPPRHDHDRAVDDLLGTAAGVRASHRRIHPSAQCWNPQPARTRAVCAVLRRSIQRDGGRVRVEEDRHARQLPAVAARAAGVPAARVAQSRRSACGSASESS